MQHECVLTDISLTAVFWMPRFPVRLQTLTHAARCCCLYFQGFFTITPCDNVVMKICRAVCSGCFYDFGACLFFCCLSEVFFLLYFVFFLLFLGRRSVRKVSHMPWARGMVMLTGSFCFPVREVESRRSFCLETFCHQQSWVSELEWRGC